MTGTARELRRELWQVYRLPVAAVPPHRPCRRLHLPTRVCRTRAAQWQAIGRRAAELAGAGRAVLIGTRTVAGSEYGAAALGPMGLAPAVLNARQDADEARVVAAAGRAGQVTIATSMAGRGTDIRLEPAVRDKGGLHVILSEHYDAARVDRQLAGRCARQGDPGSVECILSLEGHVARGVLAGLLLRAAAALGPEAGPGRRLALAGLRRDQRDRERQDHRARKATERYDRTQGELLSISGVSD
jgi:preprotein translocase subunit SecA